MSFKAINKVRMHDTDMAGIVYFARQFRYMHDAWEDLLEQEGHFFQHIFNEADYAFVIVHAEADYKKSLYVGDDLTISLYTGKISTHSFHLHYDIYRADELVGTGKTIHCCVKRDTRLKVAVPDELRELLERYPPPSYNQESKRK